MQHHKYVNAQIKTDFIMHGGIVDGEQETELFAETPKIAEQLIKERKMGEKVDMIGTMFATSHIVELPSELYAQGKLQEALHALCWVGMVACRAGVVKGEDLLDDNGAIHNLAHLCLPQKILDIQDPRYFDKIKKAVPKLIKELEEKTPGFHKYLTKKEFDAAKNAQNS